MAQLIGVSRNTVREAYIKLEQQGLLLRRHGVGTIVIQTSFAKGHHGVSRSFPMLFRETGRVASFSHETRAMVPASEEAMRVFGLNKPVDLFCASRVIYADGRPAAYIVDTFRPGIRESDLAWDDFNGDMVGLLERSFHEKDLVFQTLVMAESLDREIASLLDLEPGTAELVLQSIIYTPSDLKPLTSTLTYQNSGVCGLSISGTMKGLAGRDGGGDQ